MFFIFSLFSMFLEHVTVLKNMNQTALDINKRDKSENVHSKRLNKIYNMSLILWRKHIKRSKHNLSLENRDKEIDGYE